MSVTQASAAKSAYPTEEELGTFLVAAGLASTAPDTGVLGPYIQQAVDQFERSTGWVPFLEEASAHDYYFDAPEWGASLDLLSGFTTITAVVTGYSPESSGNTLTLNEDYYLVAYNAALDGSPFTKIDFRSTPPSGMRSIVVTGKKGFASSIPADVYQAVLQRAAGNAAAFLYPSALASKIKQGPVEIDFGGAGGRAESFGSSFQSAVSRYTRISL